MLLILIGILLSYLTGSIPTAYLFGRARGIDIRKHGSGNIGATNALRVLGKGPGITVLVIDILKGLLPVIFIGGFLASRTSVSREILVILVGIACICGHIWTVFLNFNGGKGIATTLGVLIGFACTISGLNIALAMVLATWLIVFIFTRFVSLASIISALALPFYLVFSSGSRPLMLSGILLSCFTIYRHKENIKRLMEGKEKKLFFSRNRQANTPQ